MAGRLAAQLALAGALAWLVAACLAPAPSASNGPTYPSNLAQMVSQTDLTSAGVVSLQLPSNAPPAAITAAQAIEAAMPRVFGGSDRRSLLAIARAVGRDPGAPDTTVWVVAYGPGGLFQGQGPTSTPAPIRVQIILVDDQTGAVIGAYVTAG